MGSSLRKFRRAQERRDAAYSRTMDQLDSNQRKAALYRNGITASDLDKAFKEGWDGAKREVEEFCFHAIYAAIAMVLTDSCSMDQNRVLELLREIDKKVVLCVEDQDLMNDALRKTGIEFNWNDPIERIQ